MKTAEVLSSLTIRSPSIGDIRSPFSGDMIANDVAAALAGLDGGPYSLLMAKYVDDSQYRWRLVKETHQQIGNVKSCMAAVHLFINPFTICSLCRGTGVGLGALYFVKACGICEGVGRIEVKDSLLAKMVGVRVGVWRKNHMRDYKKASALLTAWEIAGLEHLRYFLGD